MSRLVEICARRKETIRPLRSKYPLSALEDSPLWREERRDFAGALRRQPASAIAVRFLAEIKRASPSAGPIRPGADPAEIGRAYAEAGASAISVLTESEHFDGDPAFLAQVRAAVELPLLMKDFVVDEWQILWARSLGADAVLLIAAALENAQLRDYAAVAREVGLAALVEVHTAAECDRACELGAEIVGVNHRDLATFTIDLGLSERLRPIIPAERVMVAESGIRTREDVVRLESLRVDALLVGESLMRAPDPGAALRALRGAEGEA
jgi:indole-3-glycerol phosphate synthase